jgi:hypothetical protein
MVKSFITLGQGFVYQGFVYTTHVFSRKKFLNKFTHSFNLDRFSATEIMNIVTKWHSLQNRVSKFTLFKNVL